MPLLPGPLCSEVVLLVSVSSLGQIVIFKNCFYSIGPSGQGAAEVDRRIGAERSAFVRLKRSLWGRREISTATKERIYQVIVRTILLYGCETWPLRAVDQRKLEVFDNDCLRYILRCRWTDRVPTITLRRRLNLRPLSPVLLQRRLRWFGHGARRQEGELIRDVLLPISLPNWWKRVGGQLKTWASTIKDDLAGPQEVGPRRWNHDWLAISCDLAQYQRTWAAMVRDAVLAQKEAGSTQPRWKPIQVKSSRDRSVCKKNCSNRVRTPVALLHSLSGKYPWERYEPPYPPSYGLNSTTTVLLEGWIWHWITQEGWYATKQINKQSLRWTHAKRPI